jgi:hypothetical protein
MGMGIDEHELNPNHPIENFKSKRVLNEQDPITHPFGFQKLEFI